MLAERQPLTEMLDAAFEKAQELFIAFDNVLLSLL